MKRHTLKLSLVFIGMQMLLTSFSYAGINSSESCPLEKALIGKKSSSQVVEQLKELVKTQACQGLGHTCKLRGEGEVSGVWKKHRLFFNESAILGANDLDGLMENVNELRSSGICQE